MKKLSLLITLALLALLAYSLDRTSWAFALFEGDAALGWWAALTLEVALVGFISGRAVAEVLPLDPATRTDILRWSGRGLVAALCVHVVVNLTAGYVRGGAALLTLLGGSDAAYAVAAVVWLVVNAIVPALIYWLSEMLARVVRAWLVNGALVTRHDAPQEHHGAPLVSIQQVVAPPLGQVAPRDALPFDDVTHNQDPDALLANAVALVLEHGYSVKRAARETGAPESTVGRRVRTIKGGNANV